MDDLVGAGEGDGEDARETAGEAGMSMDAFIALVAGEFELDPAAVTPGARVTTDLGLDSVGVYELLMLLEDRGADLADQRLDQLVTVGDWYAAAQLGLGGSATPRS
jgi:acyl carrier protein